MRRRQGKFTGALLAAAVLTLVAGAAGAAEFSANVVTTLRGETRQGKIYIKNDKLRREYAQAGGRVILILRDDKHVIWMLEPKTRSYLEMPFDKETAAKMLNQPLEGEGKKLVGSETLNGYVTDRYETEVKTNAGNLKGTIWVAQKLGLPIRIETADKSFIEEYKDIQEGGINDTLFAIPAGYQKMGGLPGMPKP